MDVESVRLETIALLAAMGCDCEVNIEVEDVGDGFAVSTTHGDHCHLVLVRAGSHCRLN